VKNDLNRDLGKNSTGLYNPHGRTFPDLSAFSWDIAIVSGGARIRVGGTSDAAPIFTAIVALWNDRLLNVGRGPLGFLSPLTYSGRAERMGSWRDVGTVSNPGCNTTGCEATEDEILLPVMDRRILMIVEGDWSLNDRFAVRKPRLDRCQADFKDLCAEFSYLLLGSSSYIFSLIHCR